MIPERVQRALHVDMDASMQDLIEKMRTLEAFYQQNEEYHGFLPFLRVYREVTEDVSRLHQKEGFNNAEEMRRLDLSFAQRYFDAIEAFLVDGETVRPWKTYIEYCSQPDRYASLAMFLGINAHVNGDLLHSLSESGAQERADYERINTVLEQHLTDSLHYLVLREHDRLALYAELLKPLTRFELHSTVIHWRSDIWRYHTLPGSDAFVPVFEAFAEAVGDRLIRIGHSTNLLTLPWESYKLLHLRITDFETLAQQLPDPDTSQGDGQ